MPSGFWMYWASVLLGTSSRSIPTRHALSISAATDQMARTTRLRCRHALRHNLSDRATPAPVTPNSMMPSRRRRPCRTSKWGHEVKTTPCWETNDSREFPIKLEQDGPEKFIVTYGLQVHRGLTMPEPPLISACASCL